MVVSLIIILLLFYISLEFFLVVNKAGVSIEKMRAADALEEYIYITQQEAGANTSKTLINGWAVSREVQQYKDTDSIQLIEYIVYKNDSSMLPFLIKKMLHDRRQ